MSSFKDLAIQLYKVGVRHLFGIPGSGASLDVITACEDIGIPFFLNTHEASSSIMAGTIGRLSGNPGVSVSIKGPGLTNMISGLAYCKFEGYPLLSISECYTPETTESVQHKRINHGSLLNELVKDRYFWNEATETIQYLVESSIKEIPGPVHLELTHTRNQEIKENPIAHEPESQPPSKKHFFDSVHSSKRPVLIFGSVVTRNKSMELIEKIRKLKIPSFTTVSAKGVIDEDNENAAGIFVGVGKNLALEAVLLDKADLIIGIGLRNTEVLKAIPFTCKSINLDCIGENHEGFDFSVCLIDEIVVTLDEIAEILKDKIWGIDEIKQAKENLRKKLLTSSFLPANLLDVLQQYLGKDVTAVFDTGNFCVIAENIWSSHKPLDTLGAPHSRYMGVALPSAIAASIYNPAIPTICLAGDGGLPMYLSEMKLAIRLKLPLLVILALDGYLGSIRSRVLRDGLSEKSVTIQNPSWVKIFEALGCLSSVVSTLPEFETALSQWDFKSGPCFIEAQFDPALYQDMVHIVR